MFCILDNLECVLTKRLPKRHCGTFEFDCFNSLMSPRMRNPLLYRVSKKKLMPFQIQISGEFHYGTLSIPIGI